MPPRRVLLATEFFHPHQGGIETHVLALAQNLARAGLVAEVVTPFPGPSEVAGVRVHRLAAPLLPGVHTVFTTHLAAPFRELIARGGYDLVHAHLSVYNPGVMAMTGLSRRQGLPVVATFHSVLTGYAPAFAMLDRLAGWTTLGIHVTAVSVLVARQLSPIVRQADIVVLPPAIDAGAWQVAHPVPAAGRFRVVTTMRLVRRKRARVVADILALVRDRMPVGTRLEARVIGDGGQRSALERRIRQLGLHDSVTLRGRLTHDALLAEYADADAFLLPTVEESFGLATLEARAAGLPVVVREGSGPAQFITPGREGLVAASDAGLAAALVQLARDPGLRDRIADHNRQTLPPFTRDAVVAQHLDAYETAMTLSPVAHAGVGDGSQ